MLEATRLIPALFHNVPECIVALGEQRDGSLDKKLLPARELCRAWQPIRVHERFFSIAFRVRLRFLIKRGCQVHVNMVVFSGPQRMWGRKAIGCACLRDFQTAETSDD
jgi:hypothetical protein